MLYFFRFTANFCKALQRFWHILMFMIVLKDLILLFISFGFGICVNIVTNTCSLLRHWFSIGKIVWASFCSGYLFLWWKCLNLSFEGVLTNRFLYVLYFRRSQYCLFHFQTLIEIKNRIKEIRHFGTTS